MTEGARARMTSAHLTYAQLAVWQSRQLMTQNLADRWSVPAGTSEDAVTTALAGLAGRHEALRTRYREDDAVGEPIQIVVDGIRMPVEFIEIEQFADRGQVAEAVTHLISREFDLGTGAAWRAGIVRAQGEPRDVIFVGHHITTDLHALTVLRAEFLRLVQGEPASALEEPVQPQEVAAHERSEAGILQHKRTLGYWRSILTEAPVLVWPPHLCDGPLDEVRQAVLETNITSDELDTAAATVGVSAPTLLLEVLILGLSGVTELNQLPVQLSSANRFRPHMRSVVCNASLSAPIIADLADDVPLGALARDVQRKSLTAYLHGAVDCRALQCLKDAVERDRNVQLGLFPDFSYQMYVPSIYRSSGVPARRSRSTLRQSCIATPTTGPAAPGLFVTASCDDYLNVSMFSFLVRERCTSTLLRAMERGVRIAAENPAAPTRQVIETMLS